MSRESLLQRMRHADKREDVQRRALQRSKIERDIARMAMIEFIQPFDVRPVVVVKPAPAEPMPVHIDLTDLQIGYMHDGDFICDDPMGWDEFFEIPELIYSHHNGQVDTFLEVTGDYHAGDNQPARSVIRCDQWIGGLAYSEN